MFRYFVSKMANVRLDVSFDVLFEVSFRDAVRLASHLHRNGLRNRARSRAAVHDDHLRRHGRRVRARDLLEEDARATHPQHHDRLSVNDSNLSSLSSQVSMRLVREFDGQSAAESQRTNWVI